MLFKTTFIGIILLGFGCSSNSSSHSVQNSVDTIQKNTIKIFRATKHDNSFKLIINDKFYYYDTLPSSTSSSPGTYIGEVKKEKQDLIRIFLKIDNHDTLFLFNVKGIDSLLLGRKINNKGFYILTNLQKDGWLSE